MSNALNLKSTDEFDWDEELRSWLENYILEYPNHDTSILSRSEYIGIPRGVLDDYLNKTYFLPKAVGGKGVNSKSSKVEPNIREYRSKIGATVRQGFGKPYFDTNTWKHMRNALQIAINENAIVVVYGKPGIGKSKAISEFALREMRVAPLVILCSRNITGRHFVKYIAEELQLNTSGDIADVEVRIWKKLLKYPRPFFIDQANFLNERSLGSLCLFWEKAKIPIALVGTSELYKIFMYSTVTQDVRAQLTSRIALHYLLPELELSEAKGIIAHSLGSEATDEIILQIYNITGGIYRNVDMLINRVTDLKNRNADSLASKEVTLEEIVNIAGSRLMIS